MDHILKINTYVNYKNIYIERLSLGIEITNIWP